ncbi:MAG: hypothetical protein A3F72_17575 [Bacteroidetes bacterium RIFCSPLOWO2_12_FULL_35_15]|nr:MAG: hypothetical protein A3F72_17575 [Bacteroidetes bacterium RIFCSPLOWO2_12_FULL_35_15]
MQTTLKKIYDKQFEDQIVLLSYLGEVNQKNIDGILFNIKEFKQQQKIKLITYPYFKKIYSITTELLENIKKHAVSGNEKNSTEGFIVILMETNFITITSGNYILKKECSRLENWENESRTLSIESIKELSRNSVKNNKGLSAKGGASIGLSLILLWTNKNLEINLFNADSDKKIVIFTSKLYIMEKLFIAASTSSPEINFDPVSKSLTISGESRPEDIQSFYKPIFDWIGQLNALIHYTTSVSDKPVTASLIFNMVYFNSSSVKVFIQIIELFSAIEKQNDLCKTTIVWRYNTEDEDVFEAGKEIEKMCGVKMEFSENKF